MKRRSFLILLLALLCANTLTSAARSQDDDVEGSANIENPDDEDFEGSSGLPPDDEEPKQPSPKIIKDEKQARPALPTAPPPIFVTEGTPAPDASQFQLDTVTIAILVAALILALVIIITVVVCCKKKSNAEYQRGTVSNKAYV